MPTTAVVIGGTRRVGRWVSEALLIEGLAVHAVYRRDDTAAESCRDELGHAGYSLAIHRVDATDGDALLGVIDNIAGEVRGLGVLANCAGAAAAGSLLANSTADLSELWESNVLSVHNAVRAAVPYLRINGGRIVNFLSIGADTTRAFRHVPAYAAVKAALASYSRSLARELIPDSITVNCIALGITDLPAEDAPAIAAASLPAGRVVTQEDVAAAVWYLTGPASAQVTGTVVNLSGGWAL
jgi:NAD(P)-dependent dehydrogenase (short-subunit alcohol dehydrogenase family)